MTPEELGEKIAGRRHEVKIVVPERPATTSVEFNRPPITPSERNEAFTVVPPPFPPLVVPKRYESVTLSNFVPHTPSQKAALQAVVQFECKARNGESPMLALVGGTGVGKSHLLYAAAKLIHSRKHRVIAGAWNHNFADALRYGGTVPGRPNVKVSEPVFVREALYRAPVLMVDEVERTASTDFDAVELKKLACHFWEDEKPMMLTTNVHPLEDLVGEAVASRFVVVVVTGPDHRKGNP